MTTENKSGLVITNVTINKLDNPGGKILAVVDITLNEELRLSSIKVIEGCNGLFVGYPYEQNTGDEYRDVFFPISSRLRKEIEETILAEYVGD